MKLDEVNKMKKENPENVEHVKGACRFCGQIIMVDALLDYTQEDIDEAATESCGCNDATEYVEKKSQKERAKERILKQFSNFQETNRVLLEDIADAVIDEHIVKATIQISGREKCTINMDAKGKVKIKYSETRSMETEA